MTVAASCCTLVVVIDAALGQQLLRVDNAGICKGECRKKVSKCLMATIRLTDSSCKKLTVAYVGILSLRK